MYKVRPYVEPLQLQTKPTCMYSVRSYFVDTTNNQTNDNDRLQELVLKQNQLFELLGKLEIQVNGLLAQNGN